MKRVLLALVAALTMLALPAVAGAQVKPGSVSLSIMPGYLFTGSDLNVDNGMMYSLGLGYNFTENWGLELMGSLSPNLDIDNDKYNKGDFDAKALRLNGLYHFDTGTAFVPYLTAGLGGFWGSYDNKLTAVAAGNNKYKYDDYNSFAANAGLGFKYFLTDAVALRAEVNENHTFKSDSTDNVGVSAGLSFQFGGGDDACADEDNDGVCDAYDKCPGTPAGYKVDGDGCPLTATINLNVQFDTDKSVVKQQYHSEIGKVAEFMKDNPNSTTVLEGHTDSVGNDAYNLKLSQRRADAVRDTLVKVFGVPADRLSAVGYGETRPIATNDTAEGRAQNRRTVGVVTGLEK